MLKRLSSSSARPVISFSCAPQRKPKTEASIFSPFWPVAPSRMFSSTVIFDSALVSWKVRIMPSRATL